MIHDRMRFPGPGFDQLLAVSQEDIKGAGGTLVRPDGWQIALEENK